MRVRIRMVLDQENQHKLRLFLSWSMGDVSNPARNTSSDSAAVPWQVKQLARMVVHGFYGKEHGVIADILCHLTIVKEDTLCELVKLDKKQVRPLLATLKSDQIVKTKTMVEPSPDGTSTQKAHYHFLEYSSLLNLVKYKLELMRKKVETQERNTANRASFVCKSCQTTFTDLEVDRLVDPLTGSLSCSYCDGEVDEQVATPQQSQVVLMAHFNDATSPFFDLIRDIDSLNLSPDALQADLASNMANATRIAAAPGVAGNWADKGPEYNYIPQAITISIGEAEVKTQKAKERPVWLTESTVITEESKEPAEVETTNKGDDTLLKNDEVLATLMRHESRVFEEEIQPDPVPDEDADMEEVVDGDMDEDDDEGPRVSVGGTMYFLKDIDEDIVAKMTDEEKDVYIRVAQEAYADMYA